MSVLATDLTFREAVLREAVALVSDPLRDNRYRDTRLGAAVTAYLAWKENEDGAAPATLDSYERVLARACIAIDKPENDVLTADLRDVVAIFTKGQRRKVTAILKDCFRWLYDEGMIDHNPAGRLRYPRREQTLVTDLFTDIEKARIVGAQDDLMDRAGVLLILRAGIRQGELRGLQMRDFNPAERLIVVRRGKGGKGRTIPVRGALFDTLELLGFERQPTDYILCPTLGGRSTTRARWKPMGKRGAHEWWYRCLQRAGLVEEGVTSGRRMHLGRHTYATDIIRATDGNMVAAMKNLGHQSINTTVDLYTHFDLADQAGAVEALPEIEA